MGGGQEGLLLQDAGQGLPAHGATGATNAAPTNDLLAIRLQCRVPWVLPLPDQAVVREQARMVLPAHGPWLPNDASSLMLRNVIEQWWCLRRWQEQPSCSIAPSSSACSQSPGICHADPLKTVFEQWWCMHRRRKHAVLARLPHLLVYVLILGGAKQ